MTAGRGLKTSRGWIALVDIARHVHADHNTSVGRAGQ